MRQAAGETLKNYLARFTDEITYCEQVTDKEALSALKGGLNMNTLFWRDVRSKNLSTYDELVEMMKVEIVNEEMIDHRNRAAQWLPPPQRQIGRGPTSQIVSQQWTQAGHIVAPTSGQALATATLNAVPTLAYENAGPGASNPARNTGRPSTSRNRGRGGRPRDRPPEARPYCTIHRHYGHDTRDCAGLGRPASNPRNNREHNYESNNPRRSPLRRGETRRHSPSHRNDDRERPRNGQRPRRDLAPSNEQQPIREIDTIIGGPHVGGESKNAQRNYTREAKTPPMVSYLMNQSQGERAVEPITFTQEDTTGVHFPHCDALVVRAVVARNGLKRKLVDNGSSVNILFGTTFDKMAVDHELTPMSSPLYGFTGDSIIPRGKITIAVEMGALPQVAHHFMEFLVLDRRSAYHGVLGRPALKELWAVTSIHHLCIKFPTERGIATVRGDQMGSRECYLNSLRKAEPRVNMVLDTEMTEAPEGQPSTQDVIMAEAISEISLEELDPRVVESESQAAPMEELETFPVDSQDTSKVLQVGKELNEEIKEELKSFLRQNSDVFAWKHEDMIGIDPKVSCHLLQVDPSCPPHRQKRRALNTERYEALKEEVERLISNGFVREANYLKWISNPVLVKKHNGKWRVCIDFSNLNQACPKDSFPLPRIDQLVDSTAGHELLSFMDAYSGYNQIPMFPGDEESTSFITDRGLYCYKVMPFGLKNAGATYQRLVNKMLADQLGKTMEVYVDDMLVKSLMAKKHIEHLAEAFKTLRRYHMRLNPLKCAFGVASGKFLGYIVNQRGIEANPEKIKALIEMRSPQKPKEVQRLTGRLAALNRFISMATEKCLPFFKTLKGGGKFQWTPECEKAFQELKNYLGRAPLLSKPREGEPLLLYLAVAESSISSVLVREEASYQLPIYYVSKALLPAEVRYPDMEKLALSLVIASRKLRPYFQAHSVHVLTNFPLRQVLQKPDASGRLLKWAVELSEFDIIYAPRTAIKGQALADFVVEFPRLLKLK